jgi:squalene synthase HpnC
VSSFLSPPDFVAANGTDAPAWTESESLEYTRWLARSHYENFSAVSWLLPRHLHQDFFNVYSFCRWADDLGDEMGDPVRSLELLNWWQRELDALYAGEARHPVYVALRRTIEKHDIPAQPFADLIRAFIQDQTVTRYATYADLLGYCRYSANPVGRLVLHLCGYTDDERRRLSDATCTALQLANFWQDVRRDWEIGRIYIPADRMAACQYSVAVLEQDLKSGAAGPGFRAVMRELVDDTQSLFVQGLPLPGIVNRRLAVDLELFSRGGMAILEMIRRQDYDTIQKRPRLGKLRRLTLLLSVLTHQLFAPSRPGGETRNA